MTLRRTLVLAVGYVLLLAVVAFGVPLALSLRDRVDAEVRSQAKSQAEVVAASSAEPLKPGGRDTLNRLVRTSAESVRGRVVVVDVNGVLLADSADSAAVGINFSDRPEISAALAGSSYQETRYSDTLQTNLLATAVPIVDEGGTIGAVRVTQSVDAVDAAVRRSIGGIVLLAVAVLALGLIAGALIAQRIARPIRRLADAADEVASGRLEARASVEGTTEQRTLARSFNEMTDRVSRMLKRQRDFVADSSHQLRTPLTGLRLQLEEIRHAARDEEEAHAADSALHEVDRLTAMVEELLVLSRAGEHELPAEDVDLRAAADRLGRRGRRTADEHGVELIRRSEGSRALARCAAADLDRALDPLVENAIVYSGRGGEVEIVDSYGEIAVLDRGPGFAPGEEEAVRERFFRGRAGRRGPEGTGLGLPIAAELAAQWGGELRVGNRDGGGARAAIALPTAARRSHREEVVRGA
jgi:signal transduction histidine kinase